VSMHYERAPRFRRSKVDVAPLPLRYGGAWGVTAMVCRVRKNCRRAWANRLERHFTLGDCGKSNRVLCAEQAPKTREMGFP
jgi:hypothetical protein